MKIILSATAPDIHAEIDPRFGRGAYLLVVDTDTMEWKASANPGVQARGGAGVQAAQYATGQGVEAAISGDFGPNAFEALAAAGVKMYTYGDGCRTAKDAVERLVAGQLSAIISPTNTNPDHGRNA